MKHGLLAKDASRLAEYATDTVSGAEVETAMVTVTPSTQKQSFEGLHQSTLLHLPKSKFTWSGSHFAQSANPRVSSATRSGRR